MADRIVGFRESEWPAARDAINQVRRGGIEHPFYTRRQPIMDGGGDGILMQWKGTDEFLGCDDQTGVTTTGEAEIVDALISGSGSNDGTRYSVNATYMHNLVSPDGYFWAREGEDGVYFAKSGAPGRIKLSGVVDADDMLTVTVGGASITISYGSECNDSYVEGQTLTVLWDASGFTVIDECCPPDPE